MAASLKLVNTRVKWRVNQILHQNMRRDFLFKPRRNLRMNMIADASRLRIKSVDNDRRENLLNYTAIDSPLIQPKNRWKITSYNNSQISYPNVDKINTNEFMTKKEDFLKFICESPKMKVIAPRLTKQRVFSPKAVRSTEGLLPTEYTNSQELIRSPRKPESLKFVPQGMRLLDTSNKNIHKIFKLGTLSRPQKLNRVNRTLLK